MGHMNKQEHKPLYCECGPRLERAGRRKWWPVASLRSGHHTKPFLISAEESGILDKAQLEELEKSAAFRKLERRYLARNYSEAD